MQIDVWLDIRCPNCYIGKTKFLIAFDKFEHKAETSVNWRSFELSPGLVAQSGQSVYEYLAELKGRSMDWSKQMHQQVADAAAELGLIYNFDKTVIANSFDAHRLLQFSKTKGLQNTVLEALYQAYFTEGQNVADHAALQKIGEMSGLPADEVREVLASNAYAKEVRADESRAESVNITGVPFFLLNKVKGVSGGQSVESFLQNLHEGWVHYQRLIMDPNDGMDDDSCSIYGFC